MQRAITTKNEVRRRIFAKKKEALYFQYGEKANWRKINLAVVMKYFSQNPISKEWEPKKEFIELWFGIFFS